MPTTDEPVVPAAEEAPALDADVPDADVPGPDAEAAAPDADVPAAEADGRGQDEDPAGSQERARRGRRRVFVAAFLAVTGLAAVGTAGGVVGWMLAREPTTAQIEAAGVAEQQARWRMLPAQDIFPAEVTYADPDAWRDPDQASRSPRTALRVGIAPPAACSDAVDRKAGELLTRHGCVTVLRATYVDDTRTMVTTVGIAVMPDMAKAMSALSAYSTELGGDAKARLGVHAVPYAGTPAAGFTDEYRQDHWIEGHNGPYLFLRASGWSAARPRVPDDRRSEEFRFAQKLVQRLQTFFAVSDRPCSTGRVAC